MKGMMKIKSCGLAAWLLVATVAVGQKLDEQRMQRDIVVVENVLSTLLRQQFDRQRMFFPLEVKGSYQPGYGITFRLPADFTTPIVFSMDGMDAGNDVVWNTPSPPDAPGTFSYTYTIEGSEEDLKREQEHLQKQMDRLQKEMENAEKEQVVSERDKRQAIAVKEQAVNEREKAIKNKESLRERRHITLDSVRDVYNNRVIETSREFLADYGDLISQLLPSEKIVITNEGQQPRLWVGKLMNSPNRTHLSIEVLRSDVTQYKQGKLTRDQLMSRIKVVNTEAVEKVEADIELLSSIFDRLYQPDLSKTYFTEDKIYYERLKDYGVVYYMQVYSSHQQDYSLFSIPTIKEEGLDIQTRNKKVAALYPAFEKELKENILEYGRTIKSLQDNEVMIFNVKLTKCPECGIPFTLEITIKGSVLKDYA